MKTCQRGNGLVFKATRTEPYTTSDGRVLDMQVWEAPCIECGAPFEVMTPSASTRPETHKRFDLRRCKAHRLTPDQSTAKWAEAARKANTRVTPAHLVAITLAYQAGLSPVDIALIVPFGQSHIYNLIRKHKITR